MILAPLGCVFHGSVLAWPCKSLRGSCSAMEHQQSLVRQCTLECRTMCTCGAPNWSKIYSIVNFLRLCLSVSNINIYPGSDNGTISSSEPNCERQRSTWNTSCTRSDIYNPQTQEDLKRYLEQNRDHESEYWVCIFLKSHAHASRRLAVPIYFSHDIAGGVWSVCFVSRIFFFSFLLPTCCCSGWAVGSMPSLDTIRWSRLYRCNNVVDIHLHVSCFEICIINPFCGDSSTSRKRIPEVFT